MTLFLKALRAIWNNKKAYLSCVLLVALAVFALVATGSASAALESASERYYKENRLSDAFADVHNLPAGMVSSLERISGIGEVQPRLVYDARVKMPGNSKTIWLRLISYDTAYEGVPMNCPIVAGGQLAEENDIWLGRGFMDMHGLKTGGVLNAIIEGREIALNIAGLADSPEYVYAVRDPKDLFPDNEAFGIAYIGLANLGLLLNKAGTYNDLAFQLDNGYVFDDVKNDLESTLSPYGLAALYARKDQFSYAMLDSEIQQDKAMSYSMPVLFSGMSAVVLFLMLKRVIEQERTQIGTLKTFGYTNGEIMAHYLMYGLATSIVGGAVGVAVGNYYVKFLVGMYTQFYVLPGIQATAKPSLAIAGMSVAALSGAIGAYFGARPALKLSPADAMRPQAPPALKADIMEALPFLRWVLTSRGSMSIRNIQRAKGRSAFIVLGIMFSFGLLAMMCPMMTMMSDMILSKFYYVEAYDAKLSLVRPAPAEDAARQAMKLPGVEIAEPLREIPAELRRSNRKTGAVLTGLRPETTLYHLYDDEKKLFLPFPESGIVLNSFAAGELGVTQGSEVLLKTPYNEDEIAVTVRAVIHQNMSAAAYMGCDAVNRMLNLPDSADSVMIRTTDMEGVKLSLDDTKNVSSIEDTYSSIANFEQMMNSYSSMIWIVLAFGTAIAFAIIYNSATISLSEKQREYTTLRVLGMQVGEVCEISNFEYWLLFAAGCGLGVPFGRFLMQLFNAMMEGYLDNFSMPAAIPLWSYGLAALGCMAAVALSNISAKRAIRKLDMVEVLKERE